MILMTYQVKMEDLQTEKDWLSDNNIVPAIQPDVYHKKNPLPDEKYANIGVIIDDEKATVVGLRHPNHYQNEYSLAR